MPACLGNGKTLRTERAMAVFPPNWVTAAGPASSKAGMNGAFEAVAFRQEARCVILRERAPQANPTRRTAKTSCTMR